METSAEAGTTLTLRLPAVPADASLKPRSDSARDAAAQAPAPDLPAMRVLVVDDDEFNTAFVRGALPSPPLEVATAINGRAAVDAVRANPPDIVFMDIEMPVMNGFEALEQIRALEAAAGTSGRQPGRRAVIVAFSSYDDESMRRRCKEAGFDAYLSKPAPADRIHEVLRAVAEGRALSESSATATDGAKARTAPGPDDPVILAAVDEELAR
jgi:CheY-like chemotaxis protein